MIPEYFSYFSIILVLIGSYNYIKDTLHGKTQPNRVSWIFWTIAPFIGVYIGYKSRVDIPLLISTFMAGFSSLLVIIASFFNKKSYWKTTSFDILCGILSFVAIIIWVTTKNTILSLIFAILADLFAGIPTIIKSWKYSESETAGMYAWGILSQLLMFFIMTNFSFKNYAFPLYFILLNLTIILGIKKKKFIRAKM